MNQLKPIQDARIRLLEQLNYVASTSQCSLSGDRRALQDQLSMVLIAEDQLKNIESKTEDLINARDSKHRLVEITNYEYHRYRSHAGIFRTIAFLINMPTRLRKPSSAIKPKGCSVASKPAETPTTASGTHIHITNGCLSELNNMMVTIIMANMKIGIEDAKPA